MIRIFPASRSSIDGLGQLAAANLAFRRFREKSAAAALPDKRINRLHQGRWQDNMCSSRQS
jgi:hypothetical protein